MHSPSTPISSCARPLSYQPLNVAFTNCRSILPKRHHLHSLIEDVNADVVLLTETWLHPEIVDNEVLPTNLNFSVYRRDRLERRGGGVLIAVRNTLSSSFISCDDCLEVARVCVRHRALTAVFGICYRPPDSHTSFCSLLTRALTTVKEKFPDAPLFLFGDFNYPSISWPLLSTPNTSPTSDPNQFIQLTLDFNLHQVISCPTRGNHTLDLLLTTNPDDVTSVTVLPNFSDHSFLHICLSLPLRKKSPEYKKITDYKRGNYDAINRDPALFYKNFLDTYQS